MALDIVSQLELKTRGTCRKRARNFPDQTFSDPAIEQRVLLVLGEAAPAVATSCSEDASEAADVDSACSSQPQPQPAPDHCNHQQPQQQKQQCWPAGNTRQQQQQHTTCSPLAGAPPAGCGLHTALPRTFAVSEEAEAALAAACHDAVAAIFSDDTPLVMPFGDAGSRNAAAPASAAATAGPQQRAAAAVGAAADAQLQQPGSQTRTCADAAAGPTAGLVRQSPFAGAFTSVMACGDTHRNCGSSSRRWHQQFQQFLRVQRQQVQHSSQH